MVVHLGGGGTAQQEAALWRPMLASRPRVLYWPFALSGAMLAGAEEWLRGSLDEHQPGLELETWTSLAGRSGEQMRGFDLLFVGGGNTFDLLAHLRDHGALAWVRTFLDDGGDLYGGSAGAIVAGATVEVAAWHDENATGLSTRQELAGLGLVGPHALLPHATEADLPQAQRWSERLGAPLLAVPEAAGVVVDAGRATAVGPDPVWGVTASSAERLDPGAGFDVAPGGT